MNEHVYDLIIIGAGAAGLTAGIYAGRAMMDTLIIEQRTIGGMAHSTEEIVNYPGVRITSGPKLTDTMRQQAEDFDCQFKTATVTDLKLDGDIKEVICGSVTYKSYAVIVATGTEHRKLGFDGEAEFTGRGVAYCATCDGELFKDKDIYVIGGGFQAAEESIYLTRFARSVNIVMITDDFTCAKGTAEATKKHPKISIRYSTAVEKIEGSKGIEKMHLKNLATGETETINARDGETMGLFVFAGLVPLTSCVKGKLDLDQQGYILTDNNCLTSVSGVWAAGDNRPKELRQLVTSVSDGAIAADQAGKYVAELRERLNLPAIGEGRSAKEVNRETTTADNSNSNTATSDDGSKHFIKGDLETQLKGLFARMENDVYLEVFVENNAKGEEMKIFMKEVSDCGEKVHLEIHDSSEASLYDVKRFPAVVICDGNKKDTSIRFSAVPGGHELTSLALTIYRASNGSGLEDSHLKLIEEKITTDKNLLIAISLSCHLCPTLVTNAMQLCLASPHLSMEMLDVALFPELKDKYNLMSVPSLVVNEGEDQSFGPKTIDELINILS